jgi:Flp pilus assembly protein TadG
MKQKNSARGQAIILIVFGMIGLLMITALAIDGGNAYSDRRHAQNAADTSALAAALAKVNGQDYSSVGLSRAASNGYNNDGTTNTVVVYQCDNVSASCGTYQGSSKYVQVIITSNINTYFAAVLGIKTITNKVQAIAKAVPPVPTQFYNGSALVATMPGCKTQGWNSDPFVVGGGSTSTISGSGVFVNSNCSTGAYTQGGSSTINVPGGICVAPGGTFSGGGNGSTTPQNCGSQLNTNMYQLPTPDCGSQVGNITTVGSKSYIASPGTYTGTFPRVSPAGNLILQKGIYCLQGGISLNSTWNITTDANGNGDYDADEGVLLYVPSGSVTFNGSSTINLHAITPPADIYPPTAGGFPSQLAGILIYVPPTNTSPVTITGSNGSSFTGTILAPGSLVTLQGSSSATNPVNLQCQIIGYSISLGGNGNLNISYDQSVNAVTYTDWGIELTK